MVYVGVLVFLILVYLRPQDWGFMGWLAQIRPTFVVMGITAGAWLITRVGSSRTRVIRSHLDWFLLAFAGVAVLSTFKIMWIAHTWETTILFLKFLLFYFIIADVIDTERRLFAFCGLLTVSNLFVSCTALLQLAEIDVLDVGILRDPQTGIIRVMGPGLFQNPNYLAYLLAIWLPMMVYQARSPLFPKWVRLISAISIVAVLACIYHTHSRGGYLCAFGTLVLTFWERMKGGWKVPLLGLAIVAFMGLLGISRMTTLGEYTQDRSAMSRIDMWYTGIQFLKENPLLGVGFEWFKELFGRPAHSSYITVAAETGLVGFVLWIGMLFCGIRDAVALRDSTLLGEYAKAFYLGLVSYALGSLFANIQYIVVLFILLGLISAISRMREARNFVIPRWRLQSELAWASCGALSILFGLHLLIKISS